MAISRVGFNQAAGNTCTAPAVQRGDAILVIAYRDGSSTGFPANPNTAVWFDNKGAWATGGNTNCSRFAYTYADDDYDAGEFPIGTWTDATGIIVVVYRGALIGAVIGNGGSSNSINFAALAAIWNTDGSSWILGFAGHRTATNIATAPSGMTNITSVANECAAHDTNGGVSGWSSTNAGVNANSGWRSWVIELREARPGSILWCRAAGEAEAGSSATISDIDIGPPHPDRVMAVGIGVGTDGTTPTAAIINSVSASLTTIETTLYAGYRHMWLCAAVPTGCRVGMTISAPTFWEWWLSALFSMVGVDVSAGTAPVDVKNDQSSPLSVTAVVPAGGGCICAFGFRFPTGSPNAFTAGVATRSTTTSSEGLWLIAGEASDVDAGNVTVSSNQPNMLSTGVWKVLAAGLDLIEVVSEAIEPDEALGRALARLRMIGEGVEPGEVLLRAMAIARLPGDVLAIAAVEIRARALTRFRSEEQETSEARLRVRALSRFAGDGVAVSESASAVRGLVRWIADGLSASEGLLRSLALRHFATEALGASEAAARLRTLRRVRNHGVQAGEACARTMSLARPVSQGMEAGETLTRSLARRRVTDEGSSAAEVILRALGLARVRGEDVEAGETARRVMRLSRRAEEAVETSEASIGSRGLSRVVGAAMSIAEDTVSLVVEIGAAIVAVVGDGLAIAGSAYRSRALFRQTREGVGIADTLVRLRAMVRRRGEGTSIDEARSRTRSVVRRIGEPSENAEVIRKARGRFRVLQEGVSLAEVVAGYAAEAGQAIVRVVSEAVSLTATSVPARALIRVSSQAVSVAEAAIGIAALAARKVLRGLVSMRAAIGGALGFRSAGSAQAKTRPGLSGRTGSDE